jgi:hypothetical protein
MKSELAHLALTKAIQIRKQASVPLTDSICVYDLAESEGIQEIRFVDIPSLEELYWKNEKTILISSLRPIGRQAFNCGHGFGHHVFGHGMCITSLSSGNYTGKAFDPNEFLVNCFSDFLLMPKTTVCHGFAVRGWDIKKCTSYHIYVIATWLGVGYGTLIQHMRDTLKLISLSHAEELLKTKPLQLRSHILGKKTTGNLTIVDDHWKGRPVDISAGDFLLLPDEMKFEGKCLQSYEENMFGLIIQGVIPGCNGRLWSEKADWSIPVRVSRPKYIGRNIFRFEEDPDYESE